MRLSSIAALTGVAAMAVALSAPEAWAAPKHRTHAASTDRAASSQSRTRRVETRARTRITVHRRSFLDPGTEVRVGEEKYTDYAIPLTHNAASVVENTVSYHRSPLPGPFDLPSRNNPYGW